MSLSWLTYHKATSVLFLLNLVHQLFSTGPLLLHFSLGFFTLSLLPVTFLLLSVAAAHLVDVPQVVEDKSKVKGETNCHVEVEPQLLVDGLIFVVSFKQVHFPLSHVGSECSIDKLGPRHLIWIEGSLRLFWCMSRLLCLDQVNCRQKGQDLNQTLHL